MFSIFSKRKSPPTNSTYSLAVGQGGAERLNILHELSGPATIDFYKRAGLKSGMKVLDVGCGIGNTAIEVAKLIGPRGNVVGIDISAAQIEVAIENARKQNIENITFFIMDACNLPAIWMGQFDFVCSRFLLIHLTDPMITLQTMYRMLKEGGILACEEPQWSDCFSIPPSEAIQKVIDWQLRYCNLSNINFELGVQLSQMFVALNCEHITETTFQPIVEGESRLKHIWVMFIMETISKYIQNGIATREEIERVVQTLKAYADDPDTSFGTSKQHQVYGKRPSY